jgi:hypothetical protein
MRGDEPVVTSAPMEAPTRQGWRDDALFPLYGDVAKVVVRNNDQVTDTYFFDEYGDVARWEGDTKASYAHRGTYTYDSLRRMTEERWVDFDGEIISMQRYTYNADGNVDETLFYSNGERPSFRQKHLYNDQGQIAEIATYWIEEGAHELTRRYCYDYIATDSCITKICSIYNSDGELEEKEAYTYDNDDNMIGYEEYGCDNIIYSQYRYTYDIAGNLAEQCEYDGDGTLFGQSTYSYVYDSEGNAIEQAVNINDGEYYGKSCFRYDSTGNRIEESSYNANGELYSKITYEIEYR